MEKTKQTKIRCFTIGDYEEEETWLREQHKKGWKMKKFVIPCFYHFEACEPEDVIYRLDYKSENVDREYYQIYADYGWERFEEYWGWNYFRKSAADMESEKDVEIFSDNESKLAMIQQIIHTRMLPLAIIFLCCLLPQVIVRLGQWDVVTIILWVLYLMYVWIIIHSARKLRKLKKKYDMV